jgi:hypothetical protein
MSIYLKGLISGPNSIPNGLGCFDKHSFIKLSSKRLEERMSDKDESSCTSYGSVNSDDIIKNIGTLPKLKIIKNG